MSSTSCCSLWLEHKVFVGPFARSFPVQVFVAPNRWSFPLNLPLSWLGFPGDGLRCSQRIALMPLCLEFDYAVLDINLGRGRSGSILPQALAHYS